MNSKKFFENVKGVVAEIVPITSTSMGRGAQVRQFSAQAHGRFGKRSPLGITGPDAGFVRDGLMRMGFR